MKNSSHWRQQAAEKQASVSAILDLAKEENRELTTEEQTEVDQILDRDLKEIEANLLRAEKLESRAKALMGQQLENQINDVADVRTIRVPARARRSTNLKAFANTHEGEADAYAAGQFIRAVVGESQQAKQWCVDHGISIRNAMGENDDSKGGVLVPPQMESAIINLKETYGVFGRYVRNYPMSSDTASIPRRVSGLTAYAVSEAGEITASDAQLNQVNLVARKWATLTRVSSELSEDSIVSLADFVANEIAYAHAVKEDQCGFLGDGTTTYHGILGLDNALLAGSLSTATSTTIGALTMTEAMACVAKLPQYPGMMPVWFMNSAIYWNGPARLQMAAGGNMVNQLASGPMLQFAGLPVVFSQAMSSAGTTGTTWAFVGDLSMAATMGRRRGVSIVADGSRYFEYDQTAIRSTLRYDIVVHETGTASAAGPIIKCKLG